MTGSPSSGAAVSPSPAPSPITPLAYRRNALRERNLFEKLFQEINGQREKKRITVPREGMKKRYPLPWVPPSDATWVKKGKETYYRYKAHGAGDREEACVPSGHITPAHVADMVPSSRRSLRNRTSPKTFPCARNEGYRSMRNRTLPKDQAYIDGIIRSVRS
jgi:IS5 family transposase